MVDWNEYSIAQKHRDEWRTNLDSYDDSVNARKVRVVDSSGTGVDSFGEPIYPSGTGGSETITLTNASTSYQVPSSPPTDKYILILYNNSDEDIYWSYDNTTTNGILIPPDGKVVMNLAGSNYVYAYCGTAGKTLVANYKVV